MNKDNHWIKIFDYILSILIIIWVAYFLTMVVFKKYINIWFLVSTSNLIFILLSFAQIIIPVVIGLLYLYIRYFNYINLSFIKFIKNFNQKAVLWGYLLVLLFWVVYSQLMNYLWINLWKNIFDSFAATRNIPILLIFTVLGVFAAIYEELIFRWILFDLFKRFFSTIIGKKWKENHEVEINKNKKFNTPIILTIIITAVLFWFMHMQYSIYLIINVIIIGLLLWVIRYKFWLVNSIVIHIINNFVIIFWTMLMPVVIWNISYYKNINMGGNEKVLTLENNFNREKNLFLEQIIKQEIKTNQWIKDDKMINAFLKKNTDSYYNPYIFKYFFLPDGKFTKCITNLNTLNKTRCYDWTKKLYQRFKDYKRLYQIWAINKLEYLQITGLLDFIKRTFLTKNRIIKK